MRSKKKGEKVMPEEEYIVFVYNIPWANVHADSKRQWSETGHKMIENVRPNIRSGDENTRIFFFLYAAIVTIFGCLPMRQSRDQNGTASRF